MTSLRNQCPAAVEDDAGAVLGLAGEAAVFAGAGAVAAGAAAVCAAGGVAVLDDGGLPPLSDEFWQPPRASPTHAIAIPRVVRFMKFLLT
ncbi:MAG TPA: hypothetical protein VME63_03465 [Dyella sp.]|uniref:hypothetical protein n=1 Tax=Dyella sp. TaxID=1869338 RepID=UPI002CB2F961|nr:hypothetical protein [Dyella sp.]HTV84433.1 hypothetical protein [Dyella sp.]